MSSVPEFLKTQLSLIGYTQNLLCAAVEENDYGTMQIISEMLSNLTASYSHLKETPTQKPQFTTGKAVGSAIGGAAASGLARSLASNIRQFPEQQQQQQAPANIKPSSYKWGDGFQGVTMAERETDLPMQDAWE